MAACYFSPTHAQFDWEEYFRLDRQYNIPDYSALSERSSNDEAALELDYWDLGHARIKDAQLTPELFRANEIGIPAELKQLFRVDSRGRTGRLFSLRHPDFRTHAIFRARFGEPTGQLRAVPISGHASFAVQEPVSGKYFVFKMNRRFENKDRGHRNYFGKARSGLVNSTSLRQDEANELALPYHFPESLHFGLKHSDGDINLQSILVRELDPVSGSLETNEVVLPVHALLDPRSGLVDQMAFQLGYSREHWIRWEYLAELARFMAFLHFQMGYAHESHTQNLNVIVNIQTGRISRFVLRDMQDCSVMSLVRLLQGRQAHLAHWNINGESGDRFMSGHVYYYNGATSQYASLVADFLAQSMAFFGWNNENAGAYTEIFLSEYLKGVEREIGRSLQLHPSTQRAIQELGEQSGWSRMRLRQRIEIVFAQIIYHFFQDSFSGYESSSDFRYDQGTLQLYFREFGVKMNSVRWLPVAKKQTLDARDQDLDFAYGVRGEIIYRAHLETGEIDGVVLGIGRVFTDELHRAGLKPHNEINYRLDPIRATAVTRSETFLRSLGVASLRSLGQTLAKTDPQSLKVGVAGNKIFITDRRYGRVILVSPAIPDNIMEGLTDCRRLMSRTRISFEMEGEWRK